MAQKRFPDTWKSDPPQVTSYFEYISDVKYLDDPVTLTSPSCGLGWRFQFHATFTKESGSQLKVTFLPHMCSSMPLSAATIHLRFSNPSNGGAWSKEFKEVSIKTDRTMGDYKVLCGLMGKMHIEITITFSDSDGLSFPNTTPPNATVEEVVQQSLESASFVDTKFYLFSAKAGGRPAHPRAVFGKSTLLAARSTYLRDLIAQGGTGNLTGTPCNLLEDVPEEINKLDAGAFEHDDDSDLEDLEDETEVEMTTSPNKEKRGATTSNRPANSVIVDDNTREDHDRNNHSFRDGTALAINGTALKTWKAFVYYTYMNQIHFSPLKSQRDLPVSSSTAGPNAAVSCSPKSMYRFAKTANISVLKTMAKAGIMKGLSKANIVTELFSVFTSRYQEIVEIEVDFLAHPPTDRTENTESLESESIKAKRGAEKEGRESNAATTSFVGSPVKGKDGKMTNIMTSLKLKTSTNSTSLADWNLVSLSPEAHAFQVNTSPENNHAPSVTGTPDLSLSSFSVPSTALSPTLVVAEIKPETDEVGELNAKAYSGPGTSEEGTSRPSPNTAVNVDGYGDRDIGEIMKRNEEAINVRAQIHVLTKRIEELEECLRVSGGEELDPVAQTEIQEIQARLEALTKRGEELHQAAVSSTRQMTLLEMKIDLTHSLPEEAALRVEDFLGSLFAPTRKTFRLDILLPKGALGKGVKTAVQQVLTRCVTLGFGFVFITLTQSPKNKRYDLKGMSKVSGINLTVMRNAYVDLLLGYYSAKDFELTDNGAPCIVANNTI
ncbi:hypothetical protein NP233_g5188 [Leucocoprinus birnbaumii]|uniref:MATH domain-containing protein n=1 Tax=Leucocoprinus birnbaumii TaxID=56174 RepID=A0AAD5VTD8_9AGAR|nr:hypothetical protein NP233_g5188 [Leucocoprinus birnbaumii]